MGSLSHKFPRLGGGIESFPSRVVHGDMVRVTVSSARVEGDHNLGPYLPDDLDDFTHHLIQIRSSQGL